MMLKKIFDFRGRQRSNNYDSRYCIEVYFAYMGQIRRCSIDFKSDGYDASLKEYEAYVGSGIYSEFYIIAVVRYVLSPANPDSTETFRNVAINEDHFPMLIETCERMNIEYSDEIRLPLISIPFFGTNGKPYIRRFGKDNVMTIEAVVDSGESKDYERYNTII